MYECPRCDYVSKQKNHMLKHFNRKISCYVSNLDIPIENCKERLKKGDFKMKLNKTEHDCEHCNKKFDRFDRLKKHFFKCKEKKSLINIIKKQREQINNIENPVKPKPSHQFVYLLQEREFIISGENIFKIGKTTQPSERIKGYPKGSILFLNLPCDNCGETEKKLIKHFDEKFLQKCEIGREYYEGELKNLIQEFISITI
jgi:hypothetical protein